MYSRAVPPLLISSAHDLPICAQISKAMIIHIAYLSGEGRNAILVVLQVRTDEIRLAF